MATLAATVLTLIDWAKRVDPQGDIAVIVEMLNQTNEILKDMLWMEGNLPTGHRTVVRTGLPTVAWRALNNGVVPSKSTTAQIDEACGMLEAFCEVDVALAKLNGNESAFRLSEAKAFIEAMNQEMAAKLFYGNPATDPKVPLGLSPRYSDLTNALNKVNIIDAGGTQTDNCSVWYVVWSDLCFAGIFPKGSTAGLQHEDIGLETAQDTNSPQGRLRVYRDHYVWNAGFALKDWRYVARIANIDVSNLTSESSAADLIKLMIKAQDKVPSAGVGKPAFYVNRTVYTMMRIQALSKSQNAVTVEEAAGQFTTRFFGDPIRKVDQLGLAEARVT
jgi:hypothetical protein